jgi:hypothetical protein
MFSACLWMVNICSLEKKLQFDYMIVAKECQALEENVQ